MGTSRQLPAQPLSIKELTRRAEDIEYDPSIPLKYWLRSADTLLKEARVYEREGNDQQAYLLYFRHAALVLNKLSKHQDARSSENRAAFQAAEKEVAENIGKLEILKPRISQGYERYQKILLEQALRNAARQGLLHKGSPNLPEVSNETLLQQGPFGNARPLSPGKNRWIAVELAHGEERRRKRLRKDPPRLEPLDNSLEAKDNEDLRTLMQETRNRIDGKGFPINKFHSPTSRDQNSFSRHQNPRKDSPIAYSYPSVPRTGSDHQLREDQEIKTDQTSDEDRFTVPAKPPKEYFGYQSRSPKLPPKSILPDEFPLRPDKIPIIPSSESGSPTGPEPDSSSYTFNPTATLENGTALRTVFLPPTLRATFLSYALPNTKANLETCGILCGTLISNALFISKLVIPEQESTSDTCETVNESELFDYCDQEDLMVLGWIHTHPTQTCFMSSRDLHTHCGYQVMMPESIAIVCAPRQNPSWGIFRLTDPPGMKSVLNCRQTGLFHPHAESNMYTDALRPGHVFEADGLHFEVVDLRPKE